MRRIGLQNVRLIETPGNPVVYGDWLGAPGAPTILFYGHYDVQPVDPLDLWESPPFEATVRDGEIYARGVGRRQGPGVHALQGRRGAPEAERPAAGEHQVHPRRRGGGRQRATSTTSSARTRPSSAPTSSSSPTRRCSRAACRRSATACAASCTSRSICAAAAPICTPDRSAAPSRIPAFVLAQMIAQMKDRGGRIKIPGFYDDVVPLEGGGAAGVGDAAVQREEVQEGLRHPEAVRRDRLHDARAHVGAADARGQRPAVGLHRRRREDRAAGRRDGEDQHAARAESGSRTRSPSCSRRTSRRSRRRPWS